MANQIEVEIIATLDKVHKSLDQLTKEASKSGAKAGDSFSDSMDSSLASGVSGFVGALKTLAPIAAGVTGAIYGIKQALDMTFAGEKIAAITNQFDVLSERAGISSDTLIRGFESASDGLVDTTDIMTSANKALVELGDHASDLPRVFELARKASSVFGGEVTSNFELMNQAIASGNTRALKQLGIFIDSKKAIEDYARSVGVASESLSQSGKQAAVLNALLDKGSKAFEGINVNAQKTTNAFQRLKVAFTDMGETVDLIVSKVFGPTFTELANKLAELAKAVNLEIKAKLGDPAEQSAAQIKILSSELSYLATQQEAFKKRLENSIGMEKEAVSEALTIVNGQISQKRVQLDLLREEDRLLSSVNSKKNAPAEKSPIEDPDKKRENAEKLAQIQQQQEANIFQIKSDWALSHDQFDLARSNGEKALEAAKNKEIFDLKRSFNVRDLGETEGYRAAKHNLEEKYAYQGLALQEKIDKQKVAAQKSTFSTIATLSSNSNDTLAAIGKAAGITQIAIETPVAIARALAAFPPPFNFVAAGIVGVAMAAQAAAIGGVGTGGSGGSIPSGGSFGAGGTTSTSPEITEITDAGPATPNTNVQVIVQGNILDRRQTGLEIAEVINETFGTNGIVIANTA